MARRPKENMFERALFASALASVLAVGLIVAFVFARGAPLLAKVGIWQFVAGASWRPESGAFGVLPMVVGTFMVTFGALMVAVPLGVATAVFICELAPPRLAGLVRPAVEILAGIPSVVYGFFGLAVLVPMVRGAFGGSGFSVLAGSLVLAIMILPTIVGVSGDVLLAVPREYREGSLALGVTRWQTIRNVVLPAAAPGVLTAVILAMGRAVGETMAIIMVTGNSVRIPGSEASGLLGKVGAALTEPVRTLTGNVALEMGYASGDHQAALFATGVVLFCIVMILNVIARYAVRQGVTVR